MQRSPGIPTCYQAMPDIQQRQVHVTPAAPPVSGSMQTPNRRDSREVGWVGWGGGVGGGIRGVGGGRTHHTHTHTHTHTTAY